MGSASPDRIDVSSEIRRSRGRKDVYTKPVELKNRSKTESMFNIEFAFRETDAPGEERRIFLAEELKPKQKVSKEPQVNGVAVKVTEGYFEWKYKNFKVTSTKSVADSGYFYDTLKLTAEPDDSYELFQYKQRRL